MPFERFTEVGRNFRPRASIRATGQIGFNYGAVKRFSLDKYPIAILFYDKEEKRIGIKLSKDEKEQGAIKLMTRNGNGSLSARSFLNFYNIPYNKTRQFDIEIDEDNKMLVINIAQNDA